ncbi:hypothetical protein D3C81_1224920 [compost metagenome]
MPPVSSRTTMRSVPSSTSGLSVEASLRQSNTTAGRRFENRPSALRMPSNPVSGRSSFGLLSHFGPPTAPSNTASAFWHTSSVSCGSGVPFSSIAMPPNNACSVSNLYPNSSSVRFNTFSASATTSGPMPSPAITAIFLTSAIASSSLS